MGSNDYDKTRLKGPEHTRLDARLPQSPLTDFAFSIMNVQSPQRQLLILGVLVGHVVEEVREVVELVRSAIPFEDPSNRQDGREIMYANIAIARTLTTLRRLEAKIDQLDNLSNQTGYPQLKEHILTEYVAARTQQREMLERFLNNTNEIQSTMPTDLLAETVAAAHEELEAIRHDPLMRETKLSGLGKPVIDQDQHDTVPAITCETSERSITPREVSVRTRDRLTVLNSFVESLIYNTHGEIGIMAEYDAYRALLIHTAKKPGSLTTRRQFNSLMMSDNALFETLSNQNQRSSLPAFDKLIVVFDNQSGNYPYGMLTIEDNTLINNILTFVNNNQGEILDPWMKGKKETDKTAGPLDQLMAFRAWLKQLEKKWHLKVSAQSTDDDSNDGANDVMHGEDIQREDVVSPGVYEEIAILADNSPENIQAEEAKTDDPDNAMVKSTKAKREKKKNETQEMIILSILCDIIGKWFQSDRGKIVLSAYVSNPNYQITSRSLHSDGPPGLSEQTFIEQYLRKRNGLSANSVEKNGSGHLHIELPIPTLAALAICNKRKELANGYGIENVIAYVTKIMSDESSMVSQQLKGLIVEHAKNISGDYNS
jgi:hypothetical protein